MAMLGDAGIGAIDLPMINQLLGYVPLVQYLVSYKLNVLPQVAETAWLLLNSMS